MDFISIFGGVELEANSGNCKGKKKEKACVVKACKGEKIIKY